MEGVMQGAGIIMNYHGTKDTEQMGASLHSGSAF